MSDRVADHRDLQAEYKTGMYLTEMKLEELVQGLTQLHDEMAGLFTLLRVASHLYLWHHHGICTPVSYAANNSSLLS